MNVLTGVLLIISLVAMVYIAMAAKNVWIGVLIFIGLMLQVYARGTSFHGKYAVFFNSAVMGVALVGIAAWQAGWAGGWLWTPIWLLSGLLVGMGGFMTQALGKAAESDIAKMFGNIGVFVGLLCGLFAFLGPWLWAR